MPVNQQRQGFDQGRLAAVHDWLVAQARDTPYRILVARDGVIAAEWASGVEPDERMPVASAGKSLLSCALGMAVADGRIGSPDDPVVDYYPELMEIGPGQGPKEGRHAFPENASITFRQLIGNTSGYMKPGELPGRTFHYQTFGMNVLSHALARRYELDRGDEPPGSAGFGELVRRRIRDPIGGGWEWRYKNFPAPPGARLEVFGDYTDFMCSGRDLLQWGQLWLQDGRWDGRQIVPSGWLRVATRTSDMLLEHEAPEHWKYGLGFWTNDQGVLSPSLPRRHYAASGGFQSVAVFPDHELVVVQAPGLTWGPSELPGANGLLRRVLDAVS